MTALWPVQVAAVTRWKADPGVAALVGDRIFDGEAEDGAAMPYVVVGDHTERPQHTLEREGWSATLTAHVFSAYRGSREALAIVAALGAAVKEPLTLEPFGAARLRRDFLDLQVEDDHTRHALVRYRIFALESAAS